MRINGTNISMIRGDSEAIKVSCKDVDGVGVPFVLGDTLYFTIKKNTSTEEKILQKVITEFIDGIALITIFPLDTQLLKVGIYFYDIQLNKVDGTVKTIIPPSKISIESEVTYD